MECFDNNFHLLDKKHQDSVLKIVKTEQLKQYSIQVLNDHEKGNNFMGKIIKINIKGVNENDENITKYLILKIATSIQSVRDVTPIKMFYKLETTFYDCVLPEMKKIQDKYIKDGGKFNFIKCYIVHSKELEEFLIMDNITMNGFGLEPRMNFLSIDHMRLAIKHIAYYHSLSFALRKYNPELYNAVSKIIDADEYMKKTLFYINIIMSHAIKYVDDEKNKRVLEDFSKNAVSKVATSIKSATTEPYNVFCHGDCWQNNIMFKRKGGKLTDCLFLDWQIVKECSPLIDLLHFLFSASDEKLRKDHYYELIDLYYETLRSQLKKMEINAEEVYPEHVYKEQIKLLSPYGLVFSIISSNLLIREGEDIPDPEVLMKDGLPEADAFLFANQHSIDIFSDRVNGIVNSFREFGLL